MNCSYEVNGPGSGFKTVDLYEGYVLCCDIYIYVYNDISVYIYMCVCQPFLLCFPYFSVIRFV